MNIELMLLIVSIIAEATALTISLYHLTHFVL